MHIPKTAGTTFRGFLERSIRENGGNPAPFSGTYPSYANFLATAGRLGEKFDLISGHYPFHVRTLLPAGSPIISLIRNPIERCLSHIKHQIRQEEQSGVGCGVTEVNAFIELPVNRFFLASLRDLSVKYLSYEGSPSDPVAETDLSLERALRNCEESWIGLDSSLDIFQQRVFERLLHCRGTCPPLPVDNRSINLTATNELSPKNHRRLRELNDLDLRLYEKLQELEVRGDSGSRPGN